MPGNPAVTRRRLRRLRRVQPARRHLRRRAVLRALLHPVRRHRAHVPDVRARLHELLVEEVSYEEVLTLCPPT